MPKPKVTVFIPTWYGEQYLEQVLTSVFNQKTDFLFDVLVYDTSSGDATPEIIKRFAAKQDNLVWKTITKDQFQHGRTRNDAAREAKGEFIAYLTQDAIPANDKWLYELIKPFEFNDKIVGVMGKQISRPYAIPMLKYEIAGTFRNFGPDFSTSLFYKDDFIKDQATFDAVRFYSDVNSAARVKTLVNDIPYKQVNYAEDQLFGEDVINSGLMKAYAPRASVIHSNDLKLGEYAKRMFDETLGLRRIGAKMSIPGRKIIVKMIVKNSLKDSVRIIRDGEYSWKRKCYWLAVNPLFHIEKWRGVRRALLADLSNSAMLNTHSLEQTRHSSFE